MVVSLTSILGTDLISASRSTINTNYDNLNTGKADLTSPSLLGVPNSITGPYQNGSKMVATNEFVQQAISSVASATTGVSIINYPPYIITNTGTQQLAVNTTMNLHRFFVPARITINSVTVEATAVGTAGTVDITLYSEDGQTQYFSFTTASISGAAEITTSITAVTLNPGFYYFAVNPNGTADVTLRSYTTTSTLIPHPSGKSVLVGTLAITAGTPPATISPTAITYSQNVGIQANLLN